jgi:polyphosphate kinase
VLLHHPYESFDPRRRADRAGAAADPDVLAIKQTLYRTSGDSPIVKALMRGAEHGKQVTALVEIKARFDEENNIVSGRARLEEGGRARRLRPRRPQDAREGRARRAPRVRSELAPLRSPRYGQLQLPAPHDLYTDLSYFTCQAGVRRRRELALQPAHLVHRAGERGDALIVAPLGLHERMLASHRARGGSHARAGRRARIVAKMNSLVDPDVILALYRASQAGVRIDLTVRGICCLKAGVPGVSENIRVRALVDRFLEHARIFLFEANGAHEIYCSSADWMPRNFHRRVEVLFPIEDERLRARIVDEVLAVELRDDVKSHVLTLDGTYARSPRKEGLRAQSEFLRRAREAASIADERERHDRPFVVRPVRNRPTLGPAVPLDVAAPIPTPAQLTTQHSTPRDSNPDGFRVPSETREAPSREITLPLSEGTS